MWQSAPTKPILAALLCAAVLAGCAHGIAPTSLRLSPAGRALAMEAKALGVLTNEEDYFEGKLLYQALPDGIGEQVVLRQKLLDYLLRPLAALDAEALRRNPGILGTDDDFDRIYDSFRDALELFPPASLWPPGGLRLTSEERRLLELSAKLVVAVYSPRGNELPVATALFVLTAIDPTNPDSASRLDGLLAWLESGTQISVGQPGPRRLATLSDILDAVAVVWPSPAVLDRSANLAFARQDKVTGILRRPIGTGEGAHGLLSDFLLDSDALSNMSVAASTPYLRCGQIAAAQKTALRFADRPGDDPEFRQVLVAAAVPSAKAADYLALARRFLPRNELLHGTSADRIDPGAAMGVIQRALASFPNDPELLLLASRLARMLSAPLLSQRLLDEATAALVAGKADVDTLSQLAAERMELSFLRLKMHMDPERIAQAEREADRLRTQFAEARKRFGAAQFKLDETDIDAALAGGFVDAGQIDRAGPLLFRAQRGGEPGIDITRQIANLAIKRGDPQQAIVLLRQALDLRERNAPAEDTIPYVEGQAKLSYLLGNAYEVAANSPDSRKAWSVAARAWERLMLEQIRRKNLSSSAEATVEVGRLYYLLGRREEGLRKFDDAIAQDEDRDQSYLDSIAFLVQRGESDAALAIYRRALSKPGRTVSEYVKVYASLWILDLTRRSSETPDAGALAYLRAIAARQVVLRPPHAASWYAQLARFAVGQIDYATLLERSDTPGKRAEAYFYEAMRQLSNGQSDEAHALWSKVIETRMLSFFEFEMASRYLRTGAPARPTMPVDEQTI